MTTDRQHEREPLVKPDGESELYPQLTVSLMDVEDPGQHDILVVDINDAGMGIICHHPLKVGQSIHFPHDEHGWDLPDKGVVMWTFKSSEGFRAGIKFV